jgi:hypothetical protein
MTTEVSNRIMQILAMIWLPYKIHSTVNEKMHGVLEIILTHEISKDGQLYVLTW